MSIKEYIDQAIKDGKSITISYVKYGGEFSTRKISDIKYSDEFGPDYISAYCHLRNENRTFKISRIQKVDGITFCKPTGPVVTNGHITQKPAYIPSLSRNAQNAKSSNNTTLYTSGKNTKEGCYIATMAYGNYNHPKVLVLRKYRDDVLLKTALGKLFVKVYYTVSPHMVACLKRHHKTNCIIRKVLDRIVCRISKKYHV